MKSRQLSTVASYRAERVSVLALTLDNYVSTENMIPNRGGVKVAKNLPTTSTTAAFKIGDILISNIRPNFKKIWLATKEGGCSNDVLVIRPSEEINSGFLYYVLSSDDFFAYNVAASKGTKMPRGDKLAIMKYEVPDFSPAKQKEIFTILSSIDNRIRLNRKINHHLAA